MVSIPSANLLLHICCAPCSIACAEALGREGEGFSLTGFWDNPNIHPFTEYLSRRDALTAFAGQIGLPLVLHGNYGLRPFLKAVAGDPGSRCSYCYARRMGSAARYAALNGFPAFSTTLLISPYQDHERLREAGESAAREAGVSFLYRDFRPLFRQGQAQARKLGLYMQKYCGCVFSEEERFNRVLP